LGWAFTVFGWLAMLLLGLGNWWQVRVGKGGWSSDEAWKAASDDWIWLVLFVGASFYVAIDPGRSMRVWATSRLLRSDRSNYLVIGLEKLNRKIVPRSKKDDFDDVWEPLLKAAELELALELQLPDGLIKTNLLLAQPPDEIKVVARSKPGSQTPITYKREQNSPSTLAMAANKTIIRCRLGRNNDKWSRPYRCVAATPISEGTLVYGAITADSTHDAVFEGKEEIIDAVLNPYCALILLTLHAKDRSYSGASRHKR
jgi:hypothetical protein